jgi:hypothetical protein
MTRGRTDLRPADHDPREAPDLLVDGLAALGLREVLAVRAEPREPDRPAAARFARVDLPDVLAVVARRRVIRRVHGDRLGSWLMAMSGERPSAHSMPRLAPPPPAKLSTISSS